jgi:hypothetical protein
VPRCRKFALAAAASNSEPPDQNAPIQVGDGYAHKRTVIQVGAYRDFAWGVAKVRVLVKGITTEKLPQSATRYSSSPVEQADIAVETGGGLVYGADETTYVNVNEYRVPEEFGNYDKTRAVYYFHPSESSF